MEPSSTKFWLVWNSDSGYTRFRHGTEDAAVIEADRLASEHGGEFFVLEACFSVKRAAPPTLVTKLKVAEASDRT